MKKIKLTRGKYALVDNQDYDWLNQWKWHSLSNDYAARNTKNGYIRMHRLIMDAKEGIFVDHINRNKLDNRRKNLRFCNKSENAINSKKRIDGITSKYKGVSWNAERNKWRSVIFVNGKQVHLGRFESEYRAYLEYRKAVRLYFPTL